MRSDQSGIGLVVTMMAVLLMLGLTGAVIPLTTTETAVATNHRRSIQLLYAAEAALEVTISDLGKLRAWDDVLRMGRASSLWSPATHVTLVDGMVLDLSDATRDLQGRRDATGAPLVWTLLGSLSLDRLIPFDVSPGPLVAVVWLADDPGDADGVALTDSNGTLVVYAAAFGRGLARRSIRAVIRRRDEGLVEVSSWRVVR